MQALLALGAAADGGQRWARWLEELLGRASPDLAGRRVRLDLEPGVDRGGVLFVACRFRLDGGRGVPAALQAACRDELARLLGELIVERVEPELLRRTVRRHYGYLEEGLRERLVQAARQLLERGAAVPEPFRGPARKALVCARLREHLDQSNTVHLEGFIRFRLKDYLEALEAAVDRAVEDHLVEREHGEFIRLLRHFVQLQEPRPEAVHVVCRPGGDVALLHGDGTDAGAAAEVTVAAGDVEGGEALLSALVGLAPRRVVLHEGAGRLGREAAESLRQVFEGALHTCRGCRLCLPIQ